MIELMIGLGAALCLALVAVVYLAAALPRRVARLVLAEHARADTRAIAEKAALHETSSTEVAVIVEPLRALLEEQARQMLAAREHTTAAAAGEVERITRALRHLAEWLAAFASAQHAQAVAVTQTVAAPADVVPQMTRDVDRVAASGAHSSPHLPAIAPGSAERLPPEPGHRAAGLTRPSARPMNATRTPDPAPPAPAQPRSMTMIGLAAPTAPSVKPTLLSMAAVAPTARPAPTVAVQGEVGERRDGGAQ